MILLVLFSFNIPGVSGEESSTFICEEEKAKYNIINLPSETEPQVSFGETCKKYIIKVTSGTYYFVAGRIGGLMVEGANTVVSVKMGMTIKGYNKGVYVDGGTVNIIKDGTVTGNIDGVYIVNGGEANIKGGKVTGGHEGVYIWYGTANIETGSEIEGGYGVWVNSDSGTANINGGIVKGKEAGVLVKGGGTANIKGGTISGTIKGGYGVYVHTGMATIETGSTIKGDDRGVYVYQSWSKANIKGGRIIGKVVSRGKNSITGGVYTLKEKVGDDYVWERGEKKETTSSKKKCPDNQALTWDNCVGFIKYSNGDKYDGEWENDKKHGQGTYTWANGDKYDGAWEDDKRHGVGTFTWANMRDEYEGGWRNGKRHGKGIMTIKLIGYSYFYPEEWENGKKKGTSKELAKNVNEQIKIQSIDNDKDENTDKYSYTVESGDTFSEIKKEFETVVGVGNLEYGDFLLNGKKVNNPDKLNVGDVITYNVKEPSLKMENQEKIALRNKANEKLKEKEDKFTKALNKLLKDELDTYDKDGNGIINLIEAPKLKKSIKIDNFQIVFTFDTLENVQIKSISKGKKVEITDLGYTLQFKLSDEDLGDPYEGNIGTEKDGKFIYEVSIE